MQNLIFCAVVVEGILANVSYIDKTKSVTNYYVKCFLVADIKTLNKSPRVENNFPCASKHKVKLSSKLSRSGDVGFLLRFDSCFFLTLTVHPAEIKVMSFIPSSSALSFVLFFPIASLFHPVL